MPLLDPLLLQNFNVTRCSWHTYLPNPFCSGARGKPDFIKRCELDMIFHCKIAWNWKRKRDLRRRRELLMILKSKHAKCQIVRYFTVATVCLLFICYHWSHMVRVFGKYCFSARSENFKLCLWFFTNRKSLQILLTIETNLVLYMCSKEPFAIHTKLKNQLQNFHAITDVIQCCLILSKG